MKFKIIEGDVLEALKTLPDESVNTIITSPPYWGLRDYGVEGQIGLEPTLEEYLDKLLKVTAELKRVLRKDGVMFWNHGDSYGGSGCGRGDYRNNNKRSISDTNLYADKPNPQKSFKPKSLVMQNYRLAMWMVDEQGWILRNVIIWHKPNHMPSSVKDRFTNAYEPVFFFVKSKRYWFDLDAVRVPHKNLEEWKYRIKIRAGKKYKGKGHPQNTIKPARNKTLVEDYKGNGRMRNAPEPQEEGAFHPLGKNPGDVWEIPTQPFKDAHFATFPERLIEPMIKAGCPKDGIVLDPFMGSGTTLAVARRLGYSAIGIELNPDYVAMAKKRLNWGTGLDVHFEYVQLKEQVEQIVEEEQGEVSA